MVREGGGGGGGDIIVAAVARIRTHDLCARACFISVNELKLCVFMCARRHITYVNAYGTLVVSEIIYLQVIITNNKPTRNAVYRARAKSGDVFSFFFLPLLLFLS